MVSVILDKLIDVYSGSGVIVLSDVDYALLREELDISYDVELDNYRGISIFVDIDQEKPELIYD